MDDLERRIHELTVNAQMSSLTSQVLISVLMNRGIINAADTASIFREVERICVGAGGAHNEAASEQAKALAEHYEKLSRAN